MSVNTDNSEKNKALKAWSIKALCSKPNKSETLWNDNFIALNVACHFTHLVVTNMGSGLPNNNYLIFLVHLISSLQVANVNSV